MLNITVEQLIAICGNPTRQSGSQYYFRCPVCSAGGGDKHGDNLLFNESKGLLKCYACGGERQILKAINDKYGYKLQPVKFRSKLKVKWYEINKENLYNYYLATTVEPKPLELINELYKWNEEDLIDIGYDPNPSHLFRHFTEPSLVFPVFNSEAILVGIELRAIKKKEIRHTKDMPNCLAYFKMGFDTLIICEGFKDAVTFNKLYSNIQRDIATPTNGVGSLKQALETVNMNKYKEIILVLDNDEAGDKATQEIIEEYGNNKFVDGRKILKGKKDIWELLN